MPKWTIILLWAVCVSARTQRNIMDHPNWHLVNDDICGLSMSQRIIGGMNARLGQYPWVVRLGYAFVNKNGEYLEKNVTFGCGGTLINKDYVVTASHCLVDSPKDFYLVRIRLGELNVMSNPDCENGYCAPKYVDIEPSEIILHETYNKPTFRHDVAVIRLSQSVSFNEYIRPICLPETGNLDVSLVGQQAEVAGWGVVDIESGRSSSVLQAVKLPIVPTVLCQRIFDHIPIDDVLQLCVGGQIGKDSCRGDSGGPLMRVDSFGGPYKYYLFGIVSFGTARCGASTSPAVYTNVARYLPWILDHVSP
ncbi:serine protease easter-like isoform X2 [Orussus abietinus]|nr:serine protease easter-like isoform X2 [Orussus abietinus]